MTEITPRLKMAMMRESRPPYASHSRFVATAKRLMPLIALGLLALVVVWPRLDSGLQPLRGLIHIDPRLAHDLRMLHARYSGVDRNDRPYVITAAAAEQLSSDINGSIGLDGPTADLDTADHGWLEVRSKTGTYQPKSKILRLFGNASIFTDRGDEFHSETARVDLAKNTAESTDPVTGQGPFGQVTAQGFRVLDRGTTVIFLGHTDLELEPAGTQARK
ncbi:MAG: LPS export ABC transporter periplasmic protein LptC [Stellaceae bacterium]